MTLHLRRMLVREGQAIGTEGAVGGGFIFGDHRLAAARIAGRGIHRHREVGGDDPGAHQRADQRQKAGRVATGIGHEPCRSDPVLLLGFQLGETIDPARRGAMRGRGVDYPRPVVGDQRDGFARGIVWQAEDDEIGIVDRLPACLGILATIIGQGQDRQVGTPRQPVGDLQPGRARAAIDENRLRHCTRSNSRASQ